MDSLFLYGILFLTHMKMYTSENNWYYWQYAKPFDRQTGNLPFYTQFGRTSAKVKSFKQELLGAARSTLDHVAGQLVVLFSGGVDSEVMLRSLLAVGANPKVIIARYENDYNIYDVSYAVTICNILDIRYDIVDINLAKFYENDAEKMSELSQIDRPRALPYCKLLEMIDGFPVMGASDLSPYRINNDYSRKGTWMMRCWEHDIGWSKFLLAIKKPGIAEWYKWTPGLVISYMNTHWFHNLVSDKYYGKLGSNSTKIVGYKEAFSDLMPRQKKTGFENIDNLVNEFETFLQKKYNGLPYRQYVDRTVDDLYTDLTGKKFVNIY